MRNRKYAAQTLALLIAAGSGMMLRGGFTPVRAQAQNNAKPVRRVTMNPEAIQKLADEAEIRRVVDEIDPCVPQ